MLHKLEQQLDDFYACRIAALLFDISSLEEDIKFWEAKREQLRKNE